MQRIIITATMVTGETITEVAQDFGTFARLVLSFRRDADVKAVTWTTAREGGEAA